MTIATTIPNDHQLINHFCQETVFISSLPFSFLLSLPPPQYMRHCNGVKRALPVTADPPNGALGEPSLHPNPAQVTLHEASQVQRRDQVRSSAAAKSPPVLLPVLRVLV